MSTSLYDFTVNTLAGQSQPLSAYRGRVALVVNTASECGYTPQYAGLQRLFDEYKARGLVVLGFPSNDFGAQEPGGSKEIASFCSTRYGVSFPLFEKVHTNGPGQSPVYHFLAAQHGEPKWNFHKYLVGKDGTVKQAFASRIEPTSLELRQAIDAALAE
ncbi:MAG TPA: glutathione peroxidase [Polyangia bacterium]|jgi:glutathione peroxidase|nr:glutathione peroxidase [Polyangia bacterium]